ncbi:hypothetical protein ANANG_G00277540 [Anguilla anguilla]|uniref:Uncharacterized protein n=1 Tax=Anguilla anguilla TaxID=7936 RepID=A0A9D3RKE0_ANGAN|nr:hypothetical protein ANANG_G00277540 [Anguilla anguilla]
MTRLSGSHGWCFKGQRSAGGRRRGQGPVQAEAPGAVHFGCHQPNGVPGHPWGDAFLSGRLPGPGAQPDAGPEERHPLPARRHWEHLLVRVVDAPLLRNSLSVPSCSLTLGEGEAWARSSAGRGVWSAGKAFLNREHLPGRDSWSLTLHCPVASETAPRYPHGPSVFSPCLKTWRLFHRFA